MENLLERLPSGSRIAVIRLRSLGDCVLTTPALALLKAYRPDLKLTVVVEPRFAGVFEDNPDIDDIRPGATRADLTLNLHGGTRSMLLTLACRAKFRAGFAHHRYSFIYSAKIPRAQEILGVNRRVHTAEHLASAVFWLGVPQAPIPRAKLMAENAPGQYASIHPFASLPEKTWPADRFLAVADYLRDHYGLEPVFLAGPDDDVAPFSGFRVLQNAPLAQVKSLLSGAQLFVGNDSGPAHIAAAFGVPVVALFGSSDPVTWAPWRTESQVLIAPDGIRGISVAQVIAAAEAVKVKA
ncbi:MAG: glycosyltransferase family 9 protein [Bryobacteraceae bacterium]|jgi:ADP-heptose:LPS heptosyltransferase